MLLRVQRHLVTMVTARLRVRQHIHRVTLLQNDISGAGLDQRHGQCSLGFRQRPVRCESVPYLLFYGVVLLLMGPICAVKRCVLPLVNAATARGSETNAIPTTNTLLVRVRPFGVQYRSIFDESGW